MTYEGRADKDREAIGMLFDFHKGTDVTMPMHQEARRLHKMLALWVLDNVPASVERQSALKCLQQSMMWCNASIAIHTAHEMEQGRISG